MYANAVSIWPLVAKPLSPQNRKAFLTFMEGRRADLEEVQRSFTVKTEEESLAAHEQTGAIQNQEKLGQKPGGRGLFRLRLDCPTLQRRLGQTQGRRATVCFVHASRPLPASDAAVLACPSSADASGGRGMLLMPYSKTIPCSFSSMMRRYCFLAFLLWFSSTRHSGTPIFLLISHFS